MKKIFLVPTLLFSAALLPADDLPQLIKQAEQGNAEAQFKLAEYYGDTTQKHFDGRKSFEWYQKAAVQGNIPAKRRLGNYYILGRGVEKDSDKAQELWQEAAQTGDMASMYNLGTFFHGHGGPVKPDLGMKYYQQAADKGNSDAQYELGRCYANGCNGKKDYVQALFWYKKSAAQNNDNAE
ncbi:MAG: sel1 repeat family protein, partial [Lentisphaeria bacterium]|nr:sel1 repeat family protein [Lentisphaeria bacterium]